MTSLPSWFDHASPEITSFRDFIQFTLEQYRLNQSYGVEDVITATCNRGTQQLKSGAIREIHLAWLRTTALEIIKELSRQQFDRIVQELFDAKNPHARSFFANVTRTLRQFQLEGTYQVQDIVTEAYARGVKQIEVGVVIEMPIPWLRKTCLNVVREFRRKQERLHNPKLRAVEAISEDVVITQLMFEEDLQALDQAWNQLNAEDQAILTARVFENRSWQDIGATLGNAEASGLNANAARQKGYRVLQKLRKLYEVARSELKNESF